MSIIFELVHVIPVQRRSALEIADVCVVPSLDCLFSAQIYNGPAGKMLTGEGPGRAAWGAVYGKKTHYRAPDMASARIGGRSPEGRPTIELAFSLAAGPLVDIGRSEKSFRVEDENGEIDMLGWTMTGASSVSEPPNELFECARIDGSSELRIYMWIVPPLMMCLTLGADPMGRLCPWRVRGESVGRAAA